MNKKEKKDPWYYKRDDQKNIEYFRDSLITKKSFKGLNYFQTATL